MKTAAFKTRFAQLCCCSVVGFCGANFVAAPQSSAAAITLAAPSKAEMAYAARMRQIESDLRWSMARLFVSFEQMQNIQDELNRPKRDTDITALRQSRGATKTDLLSDLQKVRANAQRLRSVSPVPRAWKKWDDRLVAAGFDVERGAKGIETWILYPSDETKNSAARSLRRGQNALDGVMSELGRRTERSIATKKYF